MGESKKYLFSLLSVGVFAALIVLVFALNKWFNPDEFEHIHSAWYVQNGLRPYTDFFQHHHPLLWYVLLPFLAVFGHATRTVVAIRVLMYVLTLTIAFLAYLIASRATRSREAGLLSALVLLPTVVFVRTSLTLRPDVPMAVFGLISVYFLICFLQSGKNKYMVYSSLSAFVSFMFLQKIVFLVAAYAVLSPYLLVKKRLTVKSVAYFSLCFLAGFGAYLGYLAASGTIGDYFLTNWLFNAGHLSSGKGFPPWGDPELLRGSQVFWGLAVFSLGCALLRKNTLRELRVIAFIIAMLAISLFSYSHPWLHYLFLPIVLSSVLIGACLKAAFDKLRLCEMYRVAIVIVMMRPAMYHIPGMWDNQMHDHLKKVDFVLRNSSDADLVYDGENKFNLFRGDLHYFWYNLGPGRGLEAYNRLTDGKYADYDICELIKSKRPKFISDFDLDIEKCGLAGLYSKTKYDGLCIRTKDE